MVIVKAIVNGGVALDCFIMRAVSNILYLLRVNPDREHKINLLGYVAQNYTS